MTLAARITQAVAMLFGGAQLSNRNGFVDGALENWSPGQPNPATLSAGGAYAGPAMWRVACGVGGAGTVAFVDARATNDLAAFEGDDTTGYVTFNLTTGSTGTVAARTAGYIYQPMECASKYAGKSVTVQFKLKSNVPVTIPAILTSQSFGAGGSPSAAVLFDKAVNWAVGTAWKKFSVRMDIPSVQGKTFGTTGGDSMSIGIWFPPGVVCQISVAEAQIEDSSVGSSSDLNGNGGNPTSYEHRGKGPELQRTQRYIATVSSQMSAYQSAGLGLAYNHQWPVQMRSAPAIAAVGGSYSNASGLTAVNPTVFGARMQAVATATGAAAFNDWLLYLDARL